MEFVDIFCGIGTIRMGFEAADHKCVYSIEWDKHKRRIYSVIFGEEPQGQDIRQIRGTDIPRADCWCFGFPCQDVSVAGKQLGFKGERSSLFFEVIRMLQEVKEEDKPRYLFIENVKNLLSVNGGWDFYNLLYTMDKVGYDIEWNLLNSKDFGVPQNRERVFIIGHLRGKCTRQVFPIERESSNSCSEIGIIEGIKGHDLLKRCYSFDGCSPSLNTCSGGNHYGKFLENEQEVRNKKRLCLCKLDKPYVNGKFTSLNDAKIKNIGTNLAATIMARYCKGLGSNDDNAVLEVRPILSPERENKQQNGRRIKGVGESMFTLTKQDRHGIVISNNVKYRIRRLTPKECWRLQGISDHITDKVIAEGISDTQMYKGAGDACTVTVIYEIAKRMI